MDGHTGSGDSKTTGGTEEECLALYLNKDKAATLALMAKDYHDRVAITINSIKKMLGTASDKQREKLRGELKMYQQLKDFSTTILNDASGIFEELNVPDTRTGKIILPSKNG